MQPITKDHRKLRNAMTVADLIAELQTFPDDYEIVGSRRSGQMQVGNAVPPLLAEQVATTLRTTG